MNFVYVVILVTLPICINSKEISIGGNFTFEMPFYSGKCLPVISPYLFPTNKSLLEGRWYARYLAYDEDEVRQLDCYCWDAFYESNETAYNFIYAYENGEFVTTTTKLIQIPDKPTGTLEIESYIPKNVSTTYGALYYCDGEMLIFWDTTCMRNHSEYTRNSIVAYRNLKFAKDQKLHSERILKQLSNEIGKKLYIHEAKQSKSCKYPPAIKKPFHINYQ